MSERAEYIRNQARAAIDSFCDEALYWEDLPYNMWPREPTWIELRDAIIAELFDLDAEQRDHERCAEYVRKHCL